MVISRHGRLPALERWVRYKNGARVALDHQQPCLITEKTVETWIRTIGKLPEETTPLLAKAKLYGHVLEQDPENMKLCADTLVTTLSYFAWCGAAMLLQN